MTKVQLTHEALKSLLHYSPETGRFTWLSSEERFLRSKYAFSIHTNSRVGRIAGGISAGGYVVISINGYGFLGHRLACFYMNGFWPEQMDHINGNRQDNRWENLRLSSQAENKKNQGLRKDLTKASGHTGIYLAPRYTDRWTIRVGKKTVGYSRSLDEAIEIRKRKLEEMGYAPEHKTRPAWG